MENLANLQPQAVFHWFYELNQIPRGSGNETAVSNWLKAWAEERNLEVEQDEALNIIIRKPGSAGYENSPIVAIQGHMDMVCEKTPESTHDFLKDPIEMFVDGDWLKAKDTTLGADDGIAVAYGLAVLDADDIAHPPLEVIVTTSEETGMDGAQALKSEQIKAKYLLNIDSDVEGSFILGCAGGADLFSRFSFAKEAVSEKRGYKLLIKGLQGGHSGQMIDQELGNAIKVLARILFKLKNDNELRLSSFIGGSKHNAIPTQAEAIFTYQGNAEEDFAKTFAEIKNELSHVDPELSYELSEVEIEEAMSICDSHKLIDFLHAVPHGVQAMSMAMPGLVETSLNIAIMSEEDNQQVLQISVRSALNSAKLNLVEKIITLTQYFGGKGECSGQYPAWEYNPESSLIDKVKDIYKETSGNDSEIIAIHAGLECGLLGEILPETEMVSFGPTMHDIHTFRERLSISSTERYWNFLLKLLASFK